MPLKISNTPTFRWPVVVMVPMDGGKFDEQTFEVDFARLSAGEIADIGLAVGTGKSDEFDGFKRLIKGWAGVEDGGVPLPFNDDNLRKVLGIPGASVAILVAFREATSEVGRRKN